MQYFDIDVSFILDPLSLFFLITISIVSLPSAVYSIGYLKGECSPTKKTYAWIMFFGFVLSMALVVTVKNAFIFLVVWEIMSLVSFFFVVFDSEHEKSVQAGTIYIVMTHIGTVFITIAFLIMYKFAGSFDLFAIKESCSNMPGYIKNLLFSLLLIGFGTKAGIVPLHIWLPYAHPQAPSHISSIMSGVMIKTAIYGIIRFIICVLGVNSIFWGIAVLIIAAVSCLAGVIYALMEHDIKKLLAYHSVENIGIILLGVGASMLFIKMNMPVLAVFAMCAGLYHLVNHTIFKGLLFLCAGSVYKATGTRDIEKLGGLIKNMPWTALFFLIGAMGISALPPLNGFISEWLTLQVFFLGALKLSGGIKVFLCLCAGVLALTGGLAAACFVKAFGITFLAMARSQKAQKAKEVSLSMKLGMLFLAFLTVAFGLAAVWIIKVLSKVSVSATGMDVGDVNFTLNNLVLAPAVNNGIYLSSPLITFALISVVSIVLIVLYLCLGRRGVRIVNTWDCGYYKLNSGNEYTATAFSKPFRIAFSFFLLPYRKTEKIRDSYYHVKSFKYETFTTPVFKQYIYKPMLDIIFKAAGSMRRIQPGNIHLYLAYIFITILILIVFVNLF